jgi:hypothetical protein
VWRLPSIIGGSAAAVMIVLAVKNSSWLFGGIAIAILIIYLIWAFFYVRKHPEFLRQYR